MSHQKWKSRISTLSVLRFAAIVLTALVMVPGGAHLFSMLNKLPMSGEECFTVQAAYRGWALFAIPLFAAIAVNLALGTGAVTVLG
jgi:hypothetical protein